MMLLRLKLPCGLNTFKNKTSFQWTKQYNYGATALKYFTVFSLLSGQYQAIRIKYEVCLCLSVTQRNDCMRLANLKFIRQIDITLMVAVCQCWSLISVYLSLFFCIRWKEGCIHPSIHPLPGVPSLSIVGLWWAGSFPAATGQPVAWFTLDRLPVHHWTDTQRQITIHANLHTCRQFKDTN